jgi:MYND finger
MEKELYGCLKRDPGYFNDRNLVLYTRTGPVAIEKLFIPSESIERSKKEMNGCFCANIGKFEVNQHGESGLAMLYCPCRKVCYCSEKCQRNNWRVHEMVCPTARRREVATANRSSAWAVQKVSMPRDVKAVRANCSKERQVSH